jgi:hypothetical protein
VPREGIATLPATTLLAALAPGEHALWPLLLEALASVEEEAASSAEELRVKLFEKGLSPLLESRQASLHTHAGGVLEIWNAAAELCAWRMRLPKGSKQLARQVLSCEWSDDRWPKPILVHSTGDRIWRTPQGDVHVLVAHPAGAEDESVAALFGSLLDVTGSVSIVRFFPKMEERTIERLEWHRALAGVENLAAELAGVFRIETARPALDPEPDRARDVERVLRDNGVTCRVGEPERAASYLRYPLVPPPDAAVDLVVSAGGELHVRLNTKQPPYVHLERKSLAVDLAREVPRCIGLGAVESQLTAAGAEGSSLLPVGVDAAGKLHFADLKVLAHFLIGGAAGSGRSEWMRSAIAGLMVQNTPETLRVAVIDPQRGAFDDLAGSAFAHDLELEPEASAGDRLEALLELSEDRIRLLRSRGNTQGFPRLVAICDEWAEIAQNRGERRELESVLAHLASHAGVTGIHLLIATEQATREVLTPALRGSLAGRIALPVARLQESRLILDHIGAEHLSGPGDLLYRGLYGPVRLQGILLSREERQRIFGIRPLGPPAIASLLAATQSFE